MSRPGKIARLPLAVRDTLNLRLQDGEQGPELLAWLNAEPAVQAVLTAHFKGQPVNAQNLSEWRRRGYEVWCREQQVLELAERLHESKPELDKTIGEEELADCLHQSSMLMLARELNGTWAIEEGPERARVTLAVINAVFRVRRMRRETVRERREHPKESRPVPQAVQSEASQTASVAPARHTPPPPEREPVSAEDDQKIAAVWASAMKLAKRTPLAPIPTAQLFGPKLPAALQAA